MGFSGSRDRFGPGAARPRVLVVDDDADMREMIGDILRFSGYEAILAPNGVEAVAEVRANRPDAITLDLSMPELDGNGVLRELSGGHRSGAIPVVVISADASILQRTPQVFAVLGKPFDLSRFLATVAGACSASPGRNHSAIPA